MMATIKGVTITDDGEAARLRARFHDRQVNRYSDNLHPARDKIVAEVVIKDRPLYQPVSAREHAELMATQQSLDLDARTLAEHAALNERVKATWLSLSRPEPKSIYSPAPPAMIRREPPRPRVHLAPVKTEGKIEMRSRPHPMTGGGLAPHYLMGGNLKGRV
jgi:hypothetical protein